jgi:hypothetical protein
LSATGKADPDFWVKSRTHCRFPPYTPGGKNTVPYTLTPLRCAASMTVAFGARIRPSLAEPPQKTSVSTYCQ